MEPTNAPQGHDIFTSGLKIDETAHRHITGIAQWTKIIVITAVIGYVLVLLGLFTGSREVVTSSNEGFSDYFRSGSQGVGGAIFGIILGLLLNYFLYMFSLQSRKTLMGTEPGLLGSSFRNLKIYFIMLTVLWIIGFLFLLVVSATLA